MTLRRYGTNSPEERQERMRVAAAKKAVAKKQSTGFTKKDTSKKSSKMTAGQKLAAVSAVSDIATEGASETNTGVSTGKGALSGAQAGLMISGGNPVGAAVGAVVGGTLGAIKARAARKRQQAEIEAQKQEAFARIEGDKGDRIQKAMAGLGQAFSQNLNRRLQVRL